VCKYAPLNKYIIIVNNYVRHLIFTCITNIMFCLKNIYISLIVSYSSFILGWNSSYNFSYRNNTWLNLECHFIICSRGLRELGASVTIVLYYSSIICFLFYFFWENPALQSSNSIIFGYTLLVCYTWTILHGC
jgi:hypothetical protein